ncbi:ATP-binding protein [Patescibacteria group bacterium]|nr:ATP-binding protein [Patescibacteria group bacterium]
MINNKQQIIIIGGSPGAGKTTFASELQRQTGFLVYDIDSADMGDIPQDKRWEEFGEIYRQKLETGESAIFTGSFRMSETRKEFLTAAKEKGIDPISVFLKFPRETILQRLDKRTNDPESNHHLTGDSAQEIAKIWLDRFDEQDNLDLEKDGWRQETDPNTTPEELAREIVRGIMPIGESTRELSRR